MANPAFILFSLLHILRQEVCNIQSYINCSQTPNNSLYCVWDEWKLVCIYEVKKETMLCPVLVYLKCCDSFLRGGSSENIWFFNAIPGKN